MMKLFVAAVLISCLLVEQTSALPDIVSIVSRLSAGALRALEGVALPILNGEVGFIRRNVQGILSFFHGQEGEIMVPNTPFVIHFSAKRCRVLGIGKRFLLDNVQTCDAKASEKMLGFTAFCQRRSQAKAIECASEQVLNLLKAAARMVKTLNPSQQHLINNGKP